MMRWLFNIKNHNFHFINNGTKDRVLVFCSAISGIQELFERRLGRDEGTTSREAR